ncbi:MAG TPA: VWA domain-containing protein [Terriglobales bacterium]|nr:VWA domain-containing protein [Terriglobales bacterium]
MRGKWLLGGAGLMLAAAATLGAQRPRADEVQTGARAYHLAPFVFNSQTQSVSDEVVVRDPKGMPVGGLTRDAFTVYDNGRRQALTEFAVSSAAAPAAPVLPLAGGAVLSPAGEAAASAAPRYLALYFDDVNTSNPLLGMARQAALRFTGRMLGAGDWVGVFTNSGRDTLGFTRDRTALEQAIAALAAHPRAEAETSGCLRISQYQAYLIANHLDPSALQAAKANLAACNPSGGGAVFGNLGSGAGMLGATPLTEPPLIRSSSEALWQQARAASEDTLASMAEVVAALGREPGARVLLMASSGFLGGTLEDRQDAVIRLALHDKVTLSALDARGLEAPEAGLPMDEAMELGTVPQAMYTFAETAKMSEQMEMEAAMANLALSTGGLLFHNNNDLALGFARLGLAPSVAYELAFTPTGLVHDGKLHKLKVEVTPDRHYTVQARQAYYAPPPDTPASRLGAAIDAAMRSGASEVGLPATARIEGAAVHFHLDLHGVPFQKEKGREREKLVFTVGIFDAQGNFLAGKQAEMDLELRDKTWRALLASGLNATLTLESMPQAAQWRCVVAEANTGKVFSAAIR